MTIYMFIKKKNTQESAYFPKKSKKNEAFLFASNLILSKPRREVRFLMTGGASCRRRVLN